MKAVTKYQAADGSLFDAPANVILRDRLIADAEAAHLILGGRIDDMSFTNDGWFVQHTPEKLAAFYEAVAKIIEQEHPKETADMFRKAPQGIVHRYLDTTPRYLTLLLNRSLCMDQSNREWGQPYFALNPHQGKQTEWKR